MATTSTRTDRFLTAFAITIIVLLSACSSEDPEPEVNQPPPVDPRFVSADALVQYYNEIATVGKINIRQVINLFYAETDIQRQFVDVTRQAIPIAELEHALVERFDLDTDQLSPLAPNQPATITERSDRRAVATFVTARRKREKLQLVQIGPRWWISGYSIEYSPEFIRNRKILDLEKYQQFVQYFAPHAASVKRRLDAGEFQAPEEAIGALMVLVLTDNPQLAWASEDFFQFGR